jgi:hypothetical protein
MMQTAVNKLNRIRASTVVATHVDAGSPRRREVEAVIHDVFVRRFGARVTSFAPNLLLLERNGSALAACGWRGAQTGALFLERYLDCPIDQAMARLARQRVDRARIVEVGNLAAEKSGGSLHVILALSAHLSRLGYEWVVFTATQELVGIFSRLGLPLLALAKADPSRLGADAQAWGSYYDSEPIVVAGRIRLAFDVLGGQT